MLTRTQPPQGPGQEQGPKKVLTHTVSSHRIRIGMAQEDMSWNSIPEEADWNWEEISSVNVWCHIGTSYQNQWSWRRRSTCSRIDSTDVKSGDPASQAQQWQVTSNQPFNDKDKLAHDSEPVHALPCQISWWLVHHVAQWARNYNFFSKLNFGNSHTHPFQSLIMVKFGMWVGVNLWSAVLCKVHTVATVWRKSGKFDQIVNFGGSCSYHLQQSGPNKYSMPEWTDGVLFHAKFHSQWCDLSQQWS